MNVTSGRTGAALAQARLAGPTGTSRVTALLYHRRHLTARQLRRPTSPGRTKSRVLAAVDFTGAGFSSMQANGIVVPASSSSHGTDGSGHGTVVAGGPAAAPRPPKLREQLRGIAPEANMLTHGSDSPAWGSTSAALAAVNWAIVTRRIQHPLST